MAVKAKRDLRLCKTIGWHSISTTCLQILVDILHRYLKQLGTTVHNYSEHYNHTLPALEELSLTLNDMGINVEDLKEYIDYISPITIKEKVPRYPLEKKSNLNFLKPGSREVVTRLVHIHEHLPAMHPELSEDYSTATPSQDSDLNIKNSSSLPNLSNVAAGSSAGSTYKKPGDVEMPMANNKHVRRIISKEIGRPLRELSCVMMTTSGFLSPAKEGKAPEARVPKPLSNYTNNIINNTNNNNNVSNHNNVATIQQSVHATALSKVKTEKSERKKHSHSKSSKSSDRKICEDVHHNGHTIADESRAKKHSAVNEVSIQKAFKVSHSKSNENHKFVPRPPKPEKVEMPAPLSPVEPKVATSKPRPKKAMRAPPPPAPVVEVSEMHVEKLPTEPNKSKLNIFKRFTKPKEERVDLPPALPKNNHCDKNAQINECIEAVVKRSREKGEPNTHVSRAVIEPQPPLPSSAEPTHEFYLPPSAGASGKHLICKKKLKVHDARPNNKRPKLNHETLPPSTSPPPPPQPCVIEKAPKSVTEPEPPPYSFFRQLQNTPGLMPLSLSSNLLIPRFTPFMNFSKIGDPNGPHPEMPNLLLPPPTLMQPSSAKSNHKNAPPASVPSTSKKGVPDEKKTENNVAPVLSDKKLKRKLKKDKKEKEKKKREKKERLEKKDLKKLKLKKEKLKKKRKLAAAAVEQQQRQPAEDTSVPKIKLKLNSGSSPQLSPSAGTGTATSGGTQSPKIVIMPVLKPAEETLNAAASGGAADAQPAHRRDECEFSPELAKIVYMAKPPKQKGSSSKSSSANVSAASTSAVAQHLNNPLKPEPTIAPITLLKSGNEKNVKIKSKQSKEKSKSKKKKVAAATAAATAAPAKPKPTGFYYDADGKQVWVCPACGSQDDGTPMIGCDGGCNAWYHWECVGIKSPPNAADWYCKSCVSL
ncbi:hypothetical protein V9T40_003339 [Parthenolecanium corni]|uniref:PHD-type domain-containing protein n=1 Tax=Parthenolecanium corni TaxID=536013 RepID=A0AAN9TV48_9HEMI